MLKDVGMDPVAGKGTAIIIYTISESVFKIWLWGDWDMSKYEHISVRGKGFTHNSDLRLEIVTYVNIPV